MRIHDITKEDVSHFMTPTSLAKDTTNYVYEVSINPDKQRPLIWKTPFSDLCETYADIITPKPGRYNGAFGRVSTDLNFTTPPPANLKTNNPKYSTNILKTLAEKMDNHETEGILQKPVFDRARISNLTFKSSKIVICPLSTILFRWQKKRRRMGTHSTYNITINECTITINSETI